MPNPAADSRPDHAATPPEERYIDVGDRVVVTAAIAEPAHARGARPEAVGQHGIVTANDGWGRCDVLLDSGVRIMAWNGIDLEWEESDV